MSTLYQHNPVISPPVLATGTVSPQTAAPLTTVPITIAQYTPTAALFDDWERLELAWGRPRLMASAVWSRLWWKHYHGLVQSHITIARCGNEPLGICLLTYGVPRACGPFQLRQLHLGTAGEGELESVCVEFQDVLTAPGRRVEFLTALGKTVQELSNWDEFHAEGCLPEITDGLQLPVPSHLQPQRSWYTNLDRLRERGDKPLTLFSESPRTNLRRAIRDLPGLELDWADETEQALRFYEELVLHHQARWTASGKPGVFASSRFHDFHAELIQQLVPRGQCVLTRLRQGEQTLGLLYLFLDHGQVLYYQAGLAEPRSRHSLGMLTQYFSLLEAAQRGYQSFEFMAGDLQHKRVLSTDARELVWKTWTRENWKTGVIASLRRFKQQWGH